MAAVASVATVHSAITVNAVSKRFRRTGTPRSFKETVLRPRSLRAQRQEFWALRDITLDVAPGETLGVIGDNGSGKSTLLKLLAGILKPTSGSVRVTGSVAPLLELGVGFHGDLTGRENVFLNGAILGLDRKDMATRLNDIVDFAELWPFIDTPVRAYSSGMVVRLGFSIAVQVDPDILLVDEVLAVGDQAFQAKCFDAIGDLKRRGKTIVFVTHGLALVQRLCTRAMWLAQGGIAAEGTPDLVVGEYLKHVDQVEADAATATNEAVSEARPVTVASSTDRAAIVALETRAEGVPEVMLDAGKPAQIAVGLRAGANGDRDLGVAVSVFGVDGTRCFRLETRAGQIGPLERGHTATVTFELGYLPLSAGTFYATVELHDATGLADLHDRAYAFKVRKSGPPWGVVSVPYEVAVGVGPASESGRQQ